MKFNLFFFLTLVVLSTHLQSSDKKNSDEQWPTGSPTTPSYIPTATYVPLINNAIPVANTQAFATAIVLSAEKRNLRNSPTNLPSDISSINNRHSLITPNIDDLGQIHENQNTTERDLQNNNLRKITTSAKLQNENLSGGVKKINIAVLWASQAAENVQKLL